MNRRDFLKDLFFITTGLLVGVEIVPSQQQAIDWSDASLPQVSPEDMLRQMYNNLKGHPPHFMPKWYRELGGIININNTMSTVWVDTT